MTCYRCGQPIDLRLKTRAQELVTHALGFICCENCAAGFAETLVPIVNARNLHNALDDGANRDEPRALFFTA